MKKIVILYFFLILSIPIFALFCNIETENFAMIAFNRTSHIILESLNTILLILICRHCQKLYKQTRDERFLIFGYGFLIGLTFNLVHIFAVKVFPFDNLSVTNLENNPSLVYLFFSNLILPLSINFSLMYKPFSINNAKMNITHCYIYLFIVLSLLPLAIYFIIPQSVHNFYIAIHTAEYISYSLYLMTAAILISMKTKEDQFIPNFFIIGLIFLGFSGIAYINPNLHPVSGLLGHLLQAIGLLCLLIGFSSFQDLSKLLKLKDELVSYFSLLIVALYVFLVSIISAIFNVVIPRIAGYIFIEVLLGFQLVTYVISSISWNKIVNVYISADANRALIRILESINRISEPNIIKNTIISEIYRIYQPDKCIIVLYDKETNSFQLDKYTKFLPSRLLKNSDYVEFEANDFNNFQSIFNNIEINFSTLNEYLQRTSGYATDEETWLKNHRIKSLYTIPISSNNQILGYIILYFIKESYALTDDDRTFLKRVASHIAQIIEKN